MKLDRPVVLTPTRVELEARCRRRHVLSDVLEYGKEKSLAAAFGNVMHAGVGGYHNEMEFHSKSGEAAAIAAHIALGKEWAAQGLVGREDEKYSLAKGATMLDAYMAQAQRVGPFSNYNTKWNVLTVEDRVRFPIGDYILSFQIDRAYHSPELNKIAVIDLKTVTRPDARWKAGWYKSVQMKLYKYGAQQVYGVEDVDFVIEGLDKNVKPKVHYVMLPEWSNSMLLETVELFKRAAERDRSLIESSLDSSGAVDILKLEETALSATDYNYQDCFAYGASCPFLPLCEADPEYRAGLLHADYKQIEADY